MKQLEELAIKLVNLFNSFTIKWKITILFFIANMGILILFSGFILFRSYFLIYGTIDRNIEDLSNELITIVTENKKLPDEKKFLCDKYWVKIYNNKKKVIFSSLLAKKINKIKNFLPETERKKTLTYDIRLKGKKYLFLSPDKYGHVAFRILSKRFKNGYIQIAYPMERTEEAFQYLLAVVAWGIGIFIILIAAVAYYFSYKTLSPINEIIKQANFISEKNLNISLPVNNNDEIGNLAKTLNNLFKRLEKAFKQQKEFSANVSHELKTPLAMIKLKIENIIEDKTVDKKCKFELQKVINGIQRLQNLISKLLLISKLDYMRDNPEYFKKFQKIDLKKLICNVKNEFEEYFESKNIRVKEQLPGQTVYVKGDKDLMEKLFFNLFLNAYKYTPANESVEISLDNFNKTFKIKNSGVSIPKDKISDIFERFCIIDDSRSKIRDGAGLGLAICKAIVELHKGEITVNSKAGKFTEFVVKFL